MTVDRPGITDDVFLGGRLHMLQPEHGYRAGLDAVLLAAAVAAAAGQSVLDAGAGVGVAGLSVVARVPGVKVTLVEREPQLAALAQENIARNGLADRATVAQGDIGDSGEAWSDGRLVAEGYDHVIANPPYIAAGRGSMPPVAIKAGAHVMEAGALEAWARFLARMAAPKANLTLIHRADALGDVLGVLSRRFGGIDVMPVQPREGEIASRIIVGGVKGSRRPLRLLPPLVLHGPEGNGFLPPVEAILRHAAPLQWR